MPLTGPERVDDTLIHEESLHLRWHDEPEAPEAKRGELTRIRDSYASKIGRVQPDYDAHRDARFVQGLEYEIEQQHPELTPAEVIDEVAQRVAFYTAKLDRLVEMTRLCNVELRFRDARNKVDRLTELEELEAIQR